MESRDSPFSINRDRIGNLPDTLIHHIFSYIDMKYAVQSSILSRRWRYIWTSLPTLNFDDRLFNSDETEEEDDGFIAFVNKVLILRDNSDIQRFNLIVLYDLDRLSRLNAWVTAAVRRNVQEISIYIEHDDPQTFLFPECLFTCKSLTKLELDMGGKDYAEVILPTTTMGLPRLKSLKLASLYFDVEKLTDGFFSSCPVLESLIITDTNMNINISSLTLKHFELDNCGSYQSYSYGKKIVELYAPNLTYLSCKDFMSQDYVVENLSSLVTADIDRVVDDSEEDGEEDGNPDIFVGLPAEEKELHAQRLMKFLRALHNVKKLRVSPGFLEVVTGAPEIIDSQPPQFRNLQCLTLRTRLSRDSMHAITYLLKISPNIESLFLRKIQIDSADAGDNWEAGLSWPCMLYHLKFVEIRGFVGCLNELKFLEFLLKITVALEKVVVYCSKADSPDRVRQLQEFHEKLLTFPKASSSATILVLQSM